jgi:PAS domain S-box-containing protein
MVEEQEATNAELKSANEEFLSSNEELQSTNEELETAKEELQSTNEELKTANDELQIRNTELAEAWELAVAMVDTFSKPVLVLSAELLVKQANRAFYRMFHTTAAETEDRSFWDLGDGQWNAPALRHLLEEILPKKTEMKDFEVEHVFPAIGHRHMLLDAHLTHWGERHTEMILLAFEDITRRKQSEQERDATIALLRLLNSPDHVREVIGRLLIFLEQTSGCGTVAIRLREGEDFTYFDTRGLPRDFVLAENRLCALDAEGNVVRDSLGNPILECMCGNVLCGRVDPTWSYFTENGSFWTNCVSELVATTTVEQLGPMRGRCVSTGYESLALVPLRAGGKTHGLLHFSDRRAGRFNPALIGQLEGLADNVATALAHRWAADALGRSEERLRLATEAAQLGAWEFDPITRVIHWSDRARAILGVPAGAPGQYDVFDGCLHPDDRARVARQVARALDPAGSGEYETEYRVIWPDQSEHWVAARGRAYCEGAGASRRATRMVGTVVDVTERKRRLEQDRLLAGEKAANIAKDEFIATLSHEVRNPLNAIQGWAILLQRGILDAATSAKAVDIIVRNAEAQTRLMNDLLDVSRIIRGRYEIEPVSLDLRSAVQAALDTVRPSAEARGIRLEAALEDVGTVSGDAVRLQQLAWNLLHNAIKFTPEGGHVQVQLIASPQYGRPCSRLTVADTGIGIRPDFLPHVFDRFRQADSTITRRYAGLGLGLALVRQIAELHGGTVEASSPGEGKGATFTVWLPMLAQPGAEEATPTGATVESPSLDGLRILVVDDAADARDWLQTILGLAHAEVEAAADAVEAMALFTIWRPHVVVCDIGLPNEDGYAFIRKIRALSPEAGGQTPALAFTAFARDEDRDHALSCGYQMHLPKPADPGQVVKALASLAGGAQLG